tara:strand:+ start:33605 stop:35788 length:2184 start_codon:yes stop_codon:yes gene_type:complete
MHSHEILTTFTVAAALGVCLFTLAGYLRVSTIVVLLIGGVIAGPEVLGIVDPSDLGGGLNTIISLAVAVILFEGGLTLDLNGYRSASKEIFRILTIGVLVTWIGSALLIWTLFRFNLAFCFLAASLVIVTGPTVIGPLLHRIRVRERLHHILHWEGVLIDPVGVFIALLCYEFYVSTDGTHQLVVTEFLMRFAAGAMIGIAFGFLLDVVMRRGWIQGGHTNIFVLSMAMLNFALADLVISESGLLSVTIAGLVLGSRNTRQLRSIVSYKVELKDFLIGLLFILLAANLDLNAFFDYGWKIAVVVLGIMLLVRPLNVFLSMYGSTLETRDKLFLSWIAPRGIVAASMASLFTIELKQLDVEDAMFLETFTYSVIAGTVLAQGFTAGMVGDLLGVLRPIASGWIVVGANPVGRKVASFFQSNDIPVVVIDTNARDVRVAVREGHTALSEDAMLMVRDDHPELYICGNIIALTPNPDLNRMLCRRWSELLDGSLFRWEPSGYETEENTHLLAGVKVWDEIPLNRWMQAGSESAPLEIVRDINNIPSPDDVLLTANQNNVNPGCYSGTENGENTWLVYRPQSQAAGSTFPLAPANVILSDQKELYDLYREMIMHIHQTNPSVQPDYLLDEMWKREEDYTSLLGHGIALPHIWTDAVTRAVLIVGRPRKPVICPLTNSAIEIVFMLISPSGEPGEHLRNLSWIAKLVGTDSKRSKLRQATSAEEIYDVITSF